MTDEQLIERMRQVEWEPCQLAADRIEALVKEIAEMEAEVHAHIELWGKALREKADAEARAERLEEALLWCSWSAAFNEGGVAREGWLKVCAPLLKGADHE